jgi:small subunit ribosomal protein S17e
MGRVRTKTVKKSAKVIIERYYPKLTLDFETNKRVCDEIAIIASKRLRNKVRFVLCGLLNTGECRGS